MTQISELVPHLQRRAILQDVDDSEVELLLDRAAEDRDAVGPALEAYRGRIERMIRMRMDPRVAARTGVSDVMQDAYLEVAKRLPAYLEERAGDAVSRPEGEGAMPFFAWVRFIAAQALTQVHRTHLGTLARDAGRDVPINGLRGTCGASSLMLASALLEHGLSPSGAASIEERREILADALSELSDVDREVLFLRHFEQLSSREAAQVLGLAPSGVRVRHMKALKRLQRALVRCGMALDSSGAIGPSGHSDDAR